MSDAVPPPPPSLEPPPGYAAYEGNVGAGVGGLRSVGGLGRWAMILAIASAVITFLGTALAFGARTDAEAFLDGTVDEDTFIDATGPSTAVLSVGGVAFLAAAIVGIVWCTHIARNHRALGRRTTWGPGMAAGGWFLPPVLFVIPMLFLHEAWRASEPAVAPGSDAWRGERPHPIVYVWWVLFGIMPLAFLPATLRRFSSFSPEAEDLAEATVDDLPIQLGSAGVQLAAAIAWVLLVAMLTARHRQLTGDARR